LTDEKKGELVLNKDKRHTLRTELQDQDLTPAREQQEPKTRRH